MFKRWAVNRVLLGALFALACAQTVIAQERKGPPHWLLPADAPKQDQPAPDAENPTTPQTNASRHDAAADEPLSDGSSSEDAVVAAEPVQTNTPIRTALSAPLLAATETASEAPPIAAPEPENLPSVSHDATPVELPLSESRPLGKEATAQETPEHSQGRGATPGSLGAGAVRTTLALVFVLGLILFAWAIYRRLAAGAGGLGSQLSAGGRAPSGVLNVLGRYPISRGNTLVLLKLDRRVLLLNQTSAGFATLAEVTEPEEVASLLLKTHDEEGQTISGRFGHLLRSMERDPAIVGADLVNVDESPRTMRAAWSEIEHEADATHELASNGQLVGTESDGELADAVTTLRRRLETIKEEWS